MSSHPLALGLVCRRYDSGGLASGHYQEAPILNHRAVGQRHWRATTQIAQDCNTSQPRFPGVVTQMIMTTDFVVDTWVGGKVVQTAYTIKSGKDLDHPRTLEKSEIESPFHQTIISTTPPSTRSAAPVVAEAWMEAA